ncbi:MAG: 30S ribosomal protein S16 [Saprospiraceae bacterium]|nr:30S ribosomal protein S16 [Candidatus Opimibacter skivensis]MBP6681424.1 30S ribosomal protein S16 [Saprospiraceae bacterium]MBP8086489.1 30S ribosomal protein S16 [Saprospiraceae bacterium]
MSVRIRLQRHGRKQSPLYHIVIADARAPRDGSFIERIGVYNPMTKPATIDIDRMKAYEWMTNGAQPTETVRAILRFKGVLYYKHLQRGVSKGAMTPEDAEIKFRAWVDAKEARIQERVKATAEERKERAAQISGSVKKVVKKKVETPVEDELLSVDLAEQAAAETAADADVVEAPEVVVAEAPAEEAPAVETPVEEAPAAETPAEEANTETTPEA